MDLGPRCSEHGPADVVMIARVVMAARHAMGMAVLGVKGAMVGLGHHCPGPMLDRLDGGRCGNR